MKQFNLDEYLKNPNRKIITREGKSVRILCTDAKGNFPIVALVKIHNGAETIIRLRENGHFYNDTEDSRDLFFAPVKKSGWINVCRGCGEYNTFVCNRIFATKEEAQRENRNIIATIKIEWEE